MTVLFVKKGAEIYLQANLTEFAPFFLEFAKISLGGEFKQAVLGGSKPVFNHFVFR